MSVTAQPVFQRAVYSLLTGDGALSSLITGVFDEVATAARPPYVTIDTVTESTSDAHDRAGIEIMLQLSAWSTYRGYAECATINGHLVRLLHRPTSPLVVAGFNKISIFNDMHQFMRDPDPDLRRCMTRYRAWLEAIPA